MVRESDPFKEMGVDPKAPGRSLNKPVRDKSNPQVSRGTSFPTCKGCGKIFPPSDMADIDYCNSCADKKKKCSVCGKEFIPEESYYHRCPQCQKKAPKICRVCGKEFIPKKSHYHTCPECM